MWSLFSESLLADIGAKRNKAKKSPDEKKDEESNEGEDDHDDDSDLEKAGARKRSAFRSKLLDAKISDSDSDIEIKKRKTGWVLCFCLCACACIPLSGHLYASLTWAPKTANIRVGPTCYKVVQQW